MSKIKFKRGDSSRINTITPEVGEPVYVTDTKQLRIGDGATQGGLPLAITGSSVNSSPIGNTTPSTGKFTTVDAVNEIKLNGAGINQWPVPGAGYVGNIDSVLANGSSTARNLAVGNLTATNITVPTINGDTPVVQADVGTEPNQIPLNQYLGSMAYLDRLQELYINSGTNTVLQNFQITEVSSVTVSADITLITTVPPQGCKATLIIISSGTTSRTVTFGTGFATTGTLSTGTTADRRYTVSFVSDGTRLIETGRTGPITV